MFRRFGTPFAVDWLAKNVNGYVYTTAIPADPDLRIEGTEYSSRYGARVPRDAAFATTMGAYLDTVLPVYGEHFADWWRDRLRARDAAQLRLPRGAARPADEMTLAEAATLLEDAIDIHDRHWKIHWMLNFAQLSATLNLRAVMEKTRGAVDEELLGRLQNSASDRNWDSIEALWQMKNEVRDDPELRAAFERRGRRRRSRALRASERGRRFIAERDRAVPARVRLARRLEPRVHLPDGPRGDGAGPRARPRLPRPATTTSRPRSRRCARDIEAASRRDPRGPRGRGARGDAGRQRGQPAHGAADARPPLLHRPGRQRPRPPRAAGGRRRSWSSRAGSTSPTTSCSCATTSCGCSSATPTAIDARGIVAARRAEREAAKQIQPRDWVGTVTPSQLAFPYLVNWGYPERFHRQQSDDERRIEGIAGSPGIIEGTARVVHDGRRVRRGPRRRHPRLPDDEPGLGRPVHEDRRPRDRHRRDDLASGGARRASSGSRRSSARRSRRKRIATGDRIRVDGNARRRSRSSERRRDATAGAATPRPRRSADDDRDAPALPGVRRRAGSGALRRPRRSPSEQVARRQGLPRLPAGRRADRARGDPRRGPTSSGSATRGRPSTTTDGG